MDRPTRMKCDTKALLHNLCRVRECAPQQKIMAAVKANAYGCRIETIVPELEGRVDAFAVASLDEARQIRRLGSQTDCVLLSGFFSTDELYNIAKEGFQCVLHSEEQWRTLLSNKLSDPIHIWLKIDTGMHRLGFLPAKVPEVLDSLLACPWVDDNIGLMTHFACRDERGAISPKEQLRQFHAIALPHQNFVKSLANSAAILEFKASHADMVRPGIMLYGVSPFSETVGVDLGLQPVMHMLSAVSAIHEYPPFSPIGYDGTWYSDKPSRIGIVPIGYADGYPRVVSPNTPTWVQGFIAPIVGRVSMDMLMIDLTACPNIQVGAEVELWGKHIPIEWIAKSAGTIAYELLSKVTKRVYHV